MFTYIMITVLVLLCIRIYTYIKYLTSRTKEIEYIVKTNNSENKENNTESKHTEEPISILINSEFVYKLHTSNRNILVIGGLGFVGQYVIEFLIKCGYTITIFDTRLPTDELYNLYKAYNITYIQGTITNKEHIDAVFKRKSYDSVMHLASVIPVLNISEKAIKEINIQGTINVLDAAMKSNVKSFVYTSSALLALKSNSTSSLDVDEKTSYPNEHIDLYTSTKAAAEKIVLSYKNKSNMKVVSLRPAGIFGHGDKYWSDRLRSKFTPTVGTGESICDFVPVENVAFAHILAEQSLSRKDQSDNINGNYYFICNNEKLNHRWFNGFCTTGSQNGLSHWDQAAGCFIPIWFMYCLVYFNVITYKTIGIAPLDVILNMSAIIYTTRSYSFSFAKASSDFGYSPVMSVKDGIRHSVMKYKTTRKFRSLSSEI